MGYCCISLLITSFSHHLFNAVIYIRNIIQTTTIKRESPVSLSVRCQVFGLFLLPFYQEHHHKVGANCSQKKKDEPITEWVFLKNGPVFNKTKCCYWRAGKHSQTVHLLTQYIYKCCAASSLAFIIFTRLYTELYYIITAAVCCCCFYIIALNSRYLRRSVFLTASSKLTLFCRVRRSPFPPNIIYVFLSSLILIIIIRLTRWLANMKSSTQQ